jgi:hypothetical protein
MKATLALFIVVIAAAIIITPAYTIPASAVPLPQAEQQRIHDLAVLCTEAVSEDWHYRNFTTVTDESVLAQCDDLFVDMKNQCDTISLVMEQCSDPAYDKYLVDRGLSSRIEPEEELKTDFGPLEQPKSTPEDQEGQVQTSPNSGPFGFFAPPSNNDNNGEAGE